MQCSERLRKLITHPAVLFPGELFQAGEVPFGTEQSGLGDRMMQAK